MLKDLIARMKYVEAEAKKANKYTKEGLEMITRAELYNDRAKAAFKKGTMYAACNYLANELASLYNESDEDEKGVCYFFCDGDAVMREIGVAMQELMKKPQKKAS